MNISVYSPDDLYSKDSAYRTTYGDWQTSYDFARNVCIYLKDKGISPEVIIEPTCGIGNFICAAIDVFDSVKKIYAIEVSSRYTQEAEIRLKQYVKEKRIDCYELYNTSIFNFDFKEIARDVQFKNILILGNPPWVTNSTIGKSNGTNLPLKGNIDKRRGIDAITGKGNFDIAESICNLMIDAFSNCANVNLALLVKSSVIKNILYRQRMHPRKICDIRQLNFDAKKEFDVSVSASILICHVGKESEERGNVYDFYSRNFLHSLGWVENAFVSNIQNYERVNIIDGESPLIWRSGIKHDCSKVMELSLKGTSYTNGLKENVDVENEMVFPLLKSSDIGKGLKGVRKYMILPQKSTSEDTSKLKSIAPKTYSYLLSHAEYLDNRKSIIYKSKPRFSIFGIGEYSFAPYKIVISALYPDMIFSLVKPIGGKPVMLDDTCYLLGFDKLEYATITLYILQSDVLRHFFQSIYFKDAKRKVSRELLMRINLYQLSKLVDYGGLDISDKLICKYQSWLLSKTTPSLFKTQA